MNIFITSSGLSSQINYEDYGGNVVSIGWFNLQFFSGAKEAYLNNNLNEEKKNLFSVPLTDLGVFICLNCFCKQELIDYWNFFSII